MVCPLGWHFTHGVTRTLEGVEQVDVECHVGDGELAVDRLDRLAVHYLGAALGVADVHPEKSLDDRMEHPADELSPEGLLLSQYRPGHPAGTDHAVDIGAFGDEVVECGGRGCAVGIDVADEVGFWRELEPLNQCTAFADWLGDVDVADFGVLSRGAFDNAERVIGAAIEYDDQVEVVRMMLSKIERVSLEYRADA